MSDNNHLLECPHCGIMIEVVQVNCAIFRCGIFKDTLEQIPPHLEKKECDRLFQEKKIYGCGKPFKVTKNNDTLVADICDYL